MVDIPTLNKSVLEFRSLIESNNARRVAQEKTRIAKEKAADSKLNDSIKKLEKSIKEQGKKASQSDRDQLALLVEERSDRADAKIRQQEVKRLAQQTLGLSDKRFKEQQEANEIAKGARQRLEDLKAQLQSQGVDIKDNKNIQKLETEVAKKERDARLKSKPLESSLKEQGKDALKATGKQLARFLGPNSFFGKSIGGLLGSLNRRFISPLTSGLGAILKGGTLIAFLFGLIEFLKSPIWKEYKEKLIPAITSALESTITQFKKTFDDFFGEDGGFVKGFDGVLQDLFGLSPDSELSKGLKRFGGSIRRIFFAFFGSPDEGGPQGSLIGGFKQIIKELLGAVGLVDAVTGEVVSFKELFNPDNKFGLAFAIAALIGAFKLVVPRVLGLSRLLLGSVGIGTAGTLGAQTFPEKLTKDMLKEGERIKSGGRTFQLDKGRFKLVTDAGRLSPVLPKGFTEAKILEGAEIPKRLGGGLGKNMKFILRLMGKVAKIFPGIGVGLAAAEFSSIAQDDELSLPQKRNRILGILGGLPGSVLGALLGGAVGGLAGPGLGNFVGALIGGGAGFFAGDQIAQALAQFALGEEVTAFDRLVVDPVTRLPRNLNKILSGSGESQDLPSSGESFLNVTQGGLNIGSGFATAAEGNAAIFGNLLAGPGNGAEVFTPNNTSLMLERSNGGAGGLTVKDTSLSGQMGNIITQFNNSNVNASTAKTISNKSVSSNGNATIDKINNLVNM